MLTALRTNQRRNTLHLLGALGVVWINLVLSPCLMALGETEEHDCPHCPDVQHCDEPSPARCSYIDGIDSDGRNHLPRVPETGDLAIVVSTIPMAAPLPVYRPIAAADNFHATGPPGPSRYLRFCSFLI